MYAKKTYIWPQNQGIKQINTEITEVRTFIEQTMQALLGYNKKLKHV